jgi:hypothetical protein
MLRQGVRCRSTLFTLGKGSDIGLRSPRVRGKHALDTCCAGAYAVLEHFFDDTPREIARNNDRRERRRTAPKRSATARFEPSDAVAALGWDVELFAEGEPDLARIDTGGDRLGGGAAADLRQEQIGHDGVRTRTEFVRDSAVEFTAAHGDRRFLAP